MAQKLEPTSNMAEKKEGSLDRPEEIQTTPS
jgi:hypothetical protein